MNTQEFKKLRKELKITQFEMARMSSARIELAKLEGHNDYDGKNFWEDTSESFIINMIQHMRGEPIGDIIIDGKRT